MKLKKKMITPFVGLVVPISLSFCFTVFASSYIYYSGGSESASIELENRTAYHNAFVGAKDEWNRTATPVWITTVPGSGHSWIIDDLYATTWRGLYTPESLKYVFWGRATKFSIKLNRKYLVDDNDTAIQSTITHEFGHAFCLDDNPSNSTTPNNSIMNHSRDRSVIYKPQQDDIDGVNSAY